MITRLLALREEAKIETLMGLAGLGDLVLTVREPFRAIVLGPGVGKGRKPGKITASMHEIAEGVKTTLAVKRLAAALGWKMPSRVFSWCAL